MRQKGPGCGGAAASLCSTCPRCEDPTLRVIGLGRLGGSGPELLPVVRWSGVGLLWHVRAQERVSAGCGYFSLARRDSSGSLCPRLSVWESCPGFVFSPSGKSLPAIRQALLFFPGRRLGELLKSIQGALLLSGCRLGAPSGAHDSCAVGAEAPSLGFNKGSAGRSGIFVPCLASGKAEDLIFPSGWSFTPPPPNSFP